MSTLTVQRHEIDGPMPGLRFVIDETGSPSGRTVVWLHGALGALSGGPSADDLGDDVRLITLHHLGFGLSTGIEHFDTISDLAVAYWWALDQLHLDSAVVVGHCFGGAVAAEMAAQQPQRVAGLVLLAPYGMFDERDPGLDLYGTTAKDLLPALYTDPTGDVAASHNPPPSDARQRGEQNIERVQFLAASGRFLFPIPDTGIARRTYRLAAMPVELVWGETDRLVTRPVLDKWQAALPHARALVVPGGHMFPYESPSAANGAIQRVLNATAG